MTNDHTSVEVAVIPACDVCGDPAIADAATNIGPWAYVCERHFAELGCALGLGRGQRLVLRVPRETREEHEFAEGWEYDPADHGCR